MSFAKINYGVIGTGHIGNFHTQQVKNIKNHANLIGVYDINYEQAKKIASNNQTIAFQSISELLKMCDAVSIATPAKTHQKIAMQALKANCHTFIEKPFATSIAQCKKIIEVSDAMKLQVQVGHIERFNSTFIAFNEERVDVPLFIESQRLTPFTNRGIDTNVILDLMIHDIDLVLCLVKKPIKAIHANGINILTESLDLVNARLEFEGGCVANLVASRISDSPMRKLRVFSKNEYASLDLQNNLLTKYKITNSANKHIADSVFSLENKYILLDKKQIQKNNALYEELLAFIISIQKSEAVKVNKYDGLRAIEIALMIQKQINEQKK